MRISDWSSDVCSSDLRRHQSCLGAMRQAVADGALPQGRIGGDGGLTVQRLVRPDIQGADRDRHARHELYHRSEERRVGKALVSTCRSWLSAYHEKQKHTNNIQV